MSQTGDRHFNGLATKFKKNIYSSLKGELRLQLIWEDLQQQFNLEQRDTPLRVLDVGAGFAQLSLRLAELNHRVTITEPARDMYREARQEARDRGVIDRIHWQQCDAQSLPDSWQGQFDLVLFHAVIEWLAEPQSVLEQVKKMLKPDGCLSLLYFNYHSLVMRHMAFANLDYVEAGNLIGKGGSLLPTNPQAPERIHEYLSDWVMLQQTGIRAFSDLQTRRVRRTVDQEQLARLERTYARKDPYRQLARYIHELWRKPSET